jgi:hypothetical protein
VVVSLDFVTGANTLTSWQVDLAYNPAVLAFVAGSVAAPLFNTPSVALAPAGGAISVAATGPAGLHARQRGQGQHLRRPEPQLQGGGRLGRRCVPRGCWAWWWPW